MPVVETSQPFAPNPDYKPREGVANAGTGRAPADIYEQLHSEAPRTSIALLVAWDPVARKEVWRSENRGTIASGVLATGGGLVFQGAQKGEFSAFDAKTGRKLWSTDPQTGVVAGAVSYEIDGEQYVAQLAGYGTRDYYTPNHSRLLVYKLGGTATLPPVGELPPARKLNPVANFGTPEQIEKGGEVWQVQCVMCHETQFGNRGLFPNLLVSPMINSAQSFRTVVIDGVLEPRGMVSFKSRISEADAEAVRAYLTSRANAQAAAQQRR